jgi:hypothetical protein
LQSFIDEPALDLGGITLSAQKETVRVFYKELWDHADKSLIPEIFICTAEAMSGVRR